MAYLPDTRQDFEAAIAAAVRSAVPDAVADGVRRALRKEYLTAPEVCEVTGWSRRKLAYLKARRELPFVQRGRTLLFPTSDLEAYLQAGYVSARDARSGPGTAG